MVFEYIIINTVKNSLHENMQILIQMYNLMNNLKNVNNVIIIITSEYTVINFTFSKEQRGTL